MDNVARLHGLEHGGALLDLLRPHVQWVGGNYDRLTPPAPGESLSLAEHRLKAQLAELGFADPEPPLARIARWRSGTVRAPRHGASRGAPGPLVPGGTGYGGHPCGEV